MVVLGLLWVAAAWGSVGHCLNFWLVVTTCEDSKGNPFPPKSFFRSGHQPWLGAERH